MELFPIKITIFYFSGTGNTWWATEKLQQMLKEKKFEVEYFSVESKVAQDGKKANELINQSDLVGFGYPIYGSDIPLVFMNFIKSLTPVKNKNAFVYTTMMIFSGDGALVARRQLKKKGFKVNQATNIRMPNNVKLPYPIFKRFPIKNGEENDWVKNKKAMPKIAKLVDRIVSNKRWIQGWDPVNVAGGLMQRVEMRFGKLYKYARNYYVDEETCTQCMQCVDNCPTENISFEDEIFTWGKSCILCLRCYHLCPEDAVLYKEPTLDRKQYPRYKGPGDGFTISKLKK